MHLIFISIPFIIKIFILSILEWPLYTGFTVYLKSFPDSSGFQDHLWLNAGQGEHSAIHLTFINLPFVIKIFIMSFFEWSFYTGLTI